MHLIGTARACGASSELVADGGVSNGFQTLALLWISEYALAHRSPVEAAGRIENTGAEFFDQLAERRCSRLDDITCDLVRIDDGNAECREHFGDGGLAAGDAAGQRDQEWP